MPAPARGPQLAYSELNASVRDEPGRRRKARKIAAVLEHFLGRADLAGLRLLDVGCSTGIVADELSRRGATVVGVDIDEPGLAAAARRFGGHVGFARADSAALPLPDASVDLVVCNHIYEHVVDPVLLFAEMRRVVRPDGALYLGLGNRWGVLEPHHRLPFLSWLPPRVADRYLHAVRGVDRYHERFTGRRGLRRLTAGLTVWDYTFTVLADPGAFAADEGAAALAGRVPAAAWRALTPLLPTYLWVATTGPSVPGGPPATVPPQPVVTG